MLSIKELLTQISDAERKEREKRGLPTLHVLDMAEFPFAFAPQMFKRFASAAAQWAALEPQASHTHMMNAYGRVLLRDYVGADQSLAQAQALDPDFAFAGMRFTERPGADPVDLPPVTGAWPTTPSLFVSCDPRYFALFGAQLLRSIEVNAPDTPVHVHVLGEHWTAPKLPKLQLTVTSENPAQFIVSHGLKPNVYYHAARLVRFSQALRAANRPLIMMDTDALVTADPRFLFETDGDVGLRVRPGRIEPWNHFSACLVLGAPSGIKYFDEAATIVRRMLHNPFWGLDQYALFAAYLRTNGAVRTRRSGSRE